MKQRSSFKVLSDGKTAFDNAVSYYARAYLSNIIDQLPREVALVRELSEALKMESSRTRRLLKDFGFFTDWKDYGRKRGQDAVED